MASKRSARVLLGTSVGYAGILVTNILAFISVPITLSYFGADRYGALALVMTLVNYLTVTNFGIPTACSILASKSVDRSEQLAIVSRSFLLMAGIGLCVLALFLAVSSSPGWISILGRIPTGIDGEVRQAAFWTAVLFLPNLLTAPFLSGFIAIQKVHVERVYATLIANSSVAALVITLLLKGNLAHYAISRGLLALLCGLAGSCHFLLGYRENREIVSRGWLRLLRIVSTPESGIQSILASGSRMFVVGLAALVVWHTDNLVISHFFTVGAVTPYNVTFKLITMLFIVFTAVNPAISPHYGRAWAIGDTAWIVGAYNRVARVSSILGGLVWVGSLAFAELVINLWTGPKGYGGDLAVFAIGAYGFILSLVSVHAALLSSLNLVRYMPHIAWLEAGVNLPLSILLVRTLGIGGVALGTFVASLTTVFWLLPREIGRRTQGKVSFDWRPLAREFLVVLGPAVVAVLVTNRFVASLALRLLVNALVVVAYLVTSYYRLPASIKVQVGELVAKPLSMLTRKGARP